MKFSNSIAVILATATFMSQPVFADGGAGSHGEDGVYISGELKIREYIEEKDPKHVDDNRAFLETTPGFMDLIKEVGAVKPMLALAIWNQLLNADLWLTPYKIPIFPEGVTHLTGPKTDLQIAARYDNDILISTPAFQQGDEEYTLAHEGLHGSVPGEGPFHHKRVRDVIRYFLFNRGQMNSQDLDKIVAQSHVVLPDVATYNSINVADLEKAYSVFIQGKGTPQSLCALKSVLNVSTIGRADLLKNYGEACPDKIDLAAFFHANAPATAQLVDTLLPTPLGNMAQYITFQQKVEKPSWMDLHSKFYRDVLTRNCKSQASPHNLEVIENQRLKYQTLLKLTADAKTEISELKTKFNDSTNTDPATIAAINIFVATASSTLLLTASQENREKDYLSNLHYLENLDALATEVVRDINTFVNSYANMYNENVQLCTQYLGKDYLTLPTKN